MNRKILPAIAAVMLAAIGTFVLVSYVRGAEDRALAGERTVQVFVVTETIDRGTAGDAIQGQIAAERVPAKVKVDGAVADIADIAGRVAAVDLLPGEQVTLQRFIEPSDLKVEGPVDVPAGMQELTLSLEPQRAFGGDVAPGDFVGVAATIDFEGDAGKATHLLLNKVLVTRVKGEATNPGVAADNQAPADAARPAAPASNFLITLAVDAPSAEKVVYAADSGTLWLTRQSDESSDNGSSIQTRETIFK